MLTIKYYCFILKWKKLNFANDETPILSLYVCSNFLIIFVCLRHVVCSLAHFDTVLVEMCDQIIYYFFFFSIFLSLSPFLFICHTPFLSHSLYIKIFRFSSLSVEFFLLNVLSPSDALTVSLLLYSLIAMRAHIQWRAIECYELEIIFWLCFIQL